LINAGTCHLSLEMGGDTLHNDVGFLKLRGCPLHEGYTVPYLRVMKARSRELPHTLGRCR